MRGLDEYLKGTGRLMRAGVRPVWGPGRHGPGNNTFSYFVDPNGNVCEYTSELQQICSDEAWESRVWPPGPLESDQWGTGGLMEEFLPFAIGAPDRALWTPSPVQAHLVAADHDRPWLSGARLAHARGFRAASRRRCFRVSTD